MKKKTILDKKSRGWGLEGKERQGTGKKRIRKKYKQEKEWKTGQDWGISVKKQTTNPS